MLTNAFGGMELGWVVEGEGGGAVVDLERKSAEEFVAEDAVEFSFAQCLVDGGEIGAADEGWAKGDGADGEGIDGMEAEGALAADGGEVGVGEFGEVELVGNLAGQKHVGGAGIEHEEAGVVIVD